ncbi:MAG: molybdopterin-binding protein [Lachnospiraceae bacterium]|jgi:molybdenum cofactor synthesis domain-containing protein
MKLMRTVDAVGQMLCHDITQIIPGEKKGPVFRKGHIITEEDIPVLLSVGKDNVYIWEVNENMVHENDAARMLYAIAAGDEKSVRPSKDIKEGKIEVIAAIDGLLKIDRGRLLTVNSFGQMMIASRHGNFPVKEGDKIAGMRIIPLIIEKEKMEAVTAKTAGGHIFRVLPFQKKKVGIVTTGNEVFYHRIEDKFTPVVQKKIEEYGSAVVGHETVGDDLKAETAAIQKLLDQGADMILCTGGMSVDPDDRTPAAIREASDHIVTYGSPVLPGAMFMLAYKNRNGKEIPIVGLPGCVMFSKRTVFDLILPRLLADDPVTKEEIDGLGEGGLCLNCEVCTFPNCGFGK